MYLGYNSNGFAHHRLEDVIDILAEQGYGGIAITVDYQHLNIFEANWVGQARQIRQMLSDRGLRSTVETGARFLLDPRRKHQPTLLSPTAEARRIRREFYQRCCELAQILGSDCVSLWSGTPVSGETADELEIESRLVDELARLCETSVGTRIAFEPEPGMFIDRMDRFARLHQQVGSPNFGLTLDIGHLICQQEVPVAPHIREWCQRGKLWNVHIEDMNPQVHDHLFFGEGCVDFADTFTALHEGGYQGGVYVELSRHSYNAVEIAERSRRFLAVFLQ